MENNLKTVENTLNTGRVDKLRWVTIVLQMFVGSATAFVYCISVFIGPLATKYGWDPSQIVLAYTLMMIVGMPGSVVGGALKAKWGNKMVLKAGGLAFGAFVILSTLVANVLWFVIMFGCMASFCMYVVYVAQLANVGELFPDFRGLSMGLVIGGITVGSAMISPLSKWLVRHMDVMHCIALQGAVYGALVMVCGFLIVEAPANYRPRGWAPPEVEVLGEDAAQGEEFVHWKKALMMKGFWILFLGNIAGAIFMTGYQGNAILFTQDAVGCSASQAAWTYSLFLIVMGIAGLVLGFVSDKYLGPVKTQAFFYLGTGAALILFFVCGSNDFWAFLLMLLVFAFSAGASQALLPTLVMDAFGGKYFGILFGFFLAGVSIGSVIGPQFTTRYSADQFLTWGIGFTIVCGVLFLLAIPVLNKELGKKKF